MAGPIWSVVMATGGGKGSDTGDPRGWVCVSFKFDHCDGVMRGVWTCKCTHARGLHLYRPEKLLALLSSLKIYILKKKYDLWETSNSHLPAPTSSSPFQIAPLRLTFVPLFHQSIPLHRPSWRRNRAVHLRTLTMFIQRAEADVEVFRLFFRSSPAVRRRNLRLIEQWTDMAYGAMKSYLAGESCPEPQFLFFLGHSRKNRTFNANPTTQVKLS